MHAVVIFESLTGNTRFAAEVIADELRANGVEATVNPITQVDLRTLSAADLVFIGSWVDGIFVIGQKPARASRLAKLPTIAGKRAVVFCTYALNPGKTLDKMTAIVADRGGDVIGGMALHRKRIDEQARELVDRALATVGA